MTDTPRYKFKPYEDDNFIVDLDGKTIGLVWVAEGVPGWYGEAALKSAEIHKTDILPTRDAAAEIVVDMYNRGLTDEVYL